MFYSLALRDALFYLLLTLLWYWLARLSADSGLMADFIGVALGGLTALAFYLFHEWGHVLGGLLSRSRMTAANSLKAITLFVYQTSGNTRGQFLLMSFMGFAATALLVWFSYTQLPDQYLASRIARGFTLVQVFLAVVIELPLVVWALLGKSLPPIDQQASFKSIKRILFASSN